MARLKQTDVDKLREKMMDNVWDIMDDMNTLIQNGLMDKKEMKRILIRDLNDYISAWHKYN
jgi:hypothetical protein